MTVHSGDNKILYQFILIILVVTVHTGDNKILFHFILIILVVTVHSEDNKILFNLILINTRYIMFATVLLIIIFQMFV